MAADRTAAALHELLPYPAAVHVANPRDGPRPKAIEISRAARDAGLDAPRGPQIATVPETLLALATKDRSLAQEATDHAFIARRTSRPALTLFLDAKRGHRGVRTLREILDGPHTRSHAERTFYKLLHQARLPLPDTNVRVNGHLVDFYWPEHGLVVETDGWASHGRRSQWERDHDRDLDHFAAGVRPCGSPTCSDRSSWKSSRAWAPGCSKRRRGASGPPRGTAAS